MKQTSLDPVVLRKKAAEYEKLARKHFDLAKAIEKSGLYLPKESGSTNGKPHRSAAWRKQQSEKLKKYWAQKRKMKSGKQ